MSGPGGRTEQDVSPSGHGVGPTSPYLAPGGVRRSDGDHGPALLADPQDLELVRHVDPTVLGPTETVRIGIVLEQGHRGLPVQPHDLQVPRDTVHEGHGVPVG